MAITGNPRLGWPGGKFAEVFGAPSTFKSALLYEACRQAILLGGHALYLDMEDGFSYSLCHIVMGVPEDRFRVESPGCQEAALDLIDATVKRAVKRTTPTVIVVDSAAGCLPKSQGEKTMETAKRQQAKAAATFAWWFARSTPRRMKGSNVYVLFANQSKANLDFHNAWKAPEDTQPGGRALPYHSCIRLALTQSNIEVTEAMTIRKTTGVSVNIEVRKNKVGAPFKTCEFPFFFKRGIDNALGLFIYLREQRVLVSRGGYWKFAEAKETDKGYRLRDLVAKIKTSSVFCKELEKLARQAWEKYYDDDIDFGDE